MCPADAAVAEKAARERTEFQMRVALVGGTMAGIVGLVLFCLNQLNQARRPVKERVKLLPDYTD